MSYRNRSDRAAVWYLQRRIIANWFRRSVRSPFFWIAALFIGFLIVTQIVAAIDGPEPTGFAEDLDQRYLTASIAIILLGGILIGIWRGTTNTPAASMADVVLLMSSPISPRLTFALLMARGSLINALIISIWSLAASSGVLLGFSDTWMALRVTFSVFILILLSEFLRYAVWVGTEQVVARDPHRGYRLRLGIRAGTALTGAAAGFWLLWPVINGQTVDWREALETIVDTGEVLAVIPPLSLGASVLTPGGWSLLSGIALAALTAGVCALALYWARDYVEPVSVMAERKTDPRGQMLESGSDVQWASLAQFGVAPRVRTTIPAFGRGAWALLWASLTRWVRYQIAAAWISTFIYVVFGVLAAVGVRIGLLSIEFAWMAALIFPFFGSVNMFMDELRRQFMFLIPGSPWAKLAAGALTSVLDGVFGALVVIGVLSVIGAIPLAQAGGLLVLALAIALLGQASVALVQIILPFWVGQKTRVSVTFAVTGLGFIPGLVALVGFYITVGPVTGLVSAAAITLVIGSLLMIVAGVLFDRMEYSG
jgi:hypothetical protein